MRGPSTQSGRTAQSSTQASAEQMNERAIDQSKGRLTADLAQILNEVSRISHRLEPAVPIEWMLKRVQFLAYELQTFLQTKLGSPAEGPASKINDRDKLNLLNQFFFEEKQFRCAGELTSSSTGNCSPADGLRLNRVLSNRVGMPLVLELIYAYLADGIGISLEFVDLKPSSFLKWRTAEQAQYIDVSRNGKALSNEELIETLSRRMTSYSSSQVLEACSATSFTCEYILSIKHALGNRHDADVLLFLQETLLNYQPGNIQLIGERALLHRRLGNLKSALADLKRYFSFNEKARASSELVSLHNELVRLLDNR